MKRSSLLAALASLALSHPAPAALDRDPDVWQLLDGRVVRARFVGYDSERVMLQHGARFHEIRFDRLAPGSRDKARLLMDGDRAESPASHLPGALEPPSPASGNTRIVTTTAYSHHEADHLAYGRRSALGNTLRYGSEIRSAAADWSVYPAGTTFRVEGLPWTYVVDDYGSALVGTGVIDLYQPDMTAMKRWGRRSVRIAILQWGSYSNSARILSRRTHHAHCRAMFEAILRRIRSAAPTCVRTPRA